jgi:CRISPR-associated helicase Cas3
MTRIESQRLPQYVVPGINIHLLPHQIAMESGWNEFREVVLTAGTGTGKTLAAFLPALRRGESVIAAYPTNALLQDQAESVARLAAFAGKTARILRPEDFPANPASEDVQIAPIDGPTLEAVRERVQAKRKGDVLDELLSVSARPKIILTNPDVLYLLAGMCYRDSPSAIARLSRYQTLVLDEFHLYSGLELARLLYLEYLLRFFSASTGLGLRLAMLSATPRPEVLSLIREIHPNLHQVSPDAAVPGHMPVGSHTTVHPIRFRVELTESEKTSGDAEEGSGVVGWVARFLETKREDLRLIRNGCDARTVPALVFMNSVVQAVRLERALLAQGWTEGELGSVRGLMSQAERRWQEKTVVIATAAAEVGIDFDCRLLVLEGTELGSFIQRLGRAGRHAEAEVVLVGQPGSAGLMGLRDELSRLPSTLGRGDFLSLAAATFPLAGAHAEFASSWEGVFAATSLTEHILARVAKDYGADVSARTRVRDSLLVREKAYFADWQSGRGAGSSDVARIHAQVRRAMLRASEERSAAHGWIKVYSDNFPSFRTQTLQVTVLDQQEARRRREPTYRADLRTLARWARLGTNHVFVPNAGFRIEIHGYSDTIQRYCVLLHQPGDWPSARTWPPEGLFWLGREADVKKRIIAATLVSQAAHGRFPGPFPPTNDPVLALVLPRSTLDSLGFDWRLQTWPLRRMAGTLSDAEPRVILLGDGCLLARSVIGSDDSLSEPRYTSPPSAEGERN